MPTAELRSVLRRTEAQLPAMLTAIRELVEIESPSDNKVAVDRLGEVVARRFAAIGGQAKRHQVVSRGDHLQIYFAAAKKPVLLLGHLDTVYPLGTLANMAFRQDKQRVHGPGVLDMKAGIVMMEFAIRALQASQALPSVTILLTTDEEVGSTTSRALIEKLAKESAAVFVCEPAQGPQGALKTARKGVGDYRIKVTGRAAHAGVDFEKGHSAILELAQQIERIAGFTDRKRGLTTNVGVIRGGTRTNVIAAEAEAEVDVRIARAGDAKILAKKFARLRPFDRGCKLEVSGGVNRPPMERSAAIAALFRRAKALAAEIGWKLEEASTGGGSDGNFTAALGVPTLDGMGAAGEGAHAAHENVVLSELPRRTALLAAMMSSVAQSSKP
jgi:glutamate carboxypeptidase